MVRRAIAAICLTAAVLSSPGEARKPKWHELEGYTYEQYVADFSKPAATPQRRAYFEKNLKTIKLINSDARNTWRAGVNGFTDMSPEEFKRLNGFRKSKAPRNPSKVHGAPTAADAKLPLTVDWRTAESPRVLTGMKHQGSCGSCWAHSATETIESHYALQTGMLPVLSVAQINSCTATCFGCDGGDHVMAWEWLANKTIQRPEVLKSLTENWAYPIEAHDWFWRPTYKKTTPCKDISKEWTKPATSWFAELTAAGVSGYGAINSNSPRGAPAAQKALRDIGPQSISVAARPWAFYESGVFKPVDGVPHQWDVDHAVQLVGYGYDKVLDANYWIVRNSWGTLWGEEGYIRVWRAPEGEPEPCGVPPGQEARVCGTSGILNEVAYPIVYKASPTKFG